MRFMSAEYEPENAIGSGRAVGNPPSGATVKSCV
jgi:hypothetical protein